MKHKVVINLCYGGFELSPLATKRYFEIKYPEKKLFFYKRDYENDQCVKVNELTGDEDSYYIDIVSEDLGESFSMDERSSKITDDNFVWLWDVDIERHDPVLIQVVEELGDKANAAYSKLQIVEIEGNLYRIDEYDGYESVDTPNSINWTEI